MKMRFYVDGIVESMMPAPTPKDEFALKKVWQVALLADHSHFGQDGEERAKANKSWSTGPAQGRLDLSIDVPEAMKYFVKGDFVTFDLKAEKAEKPAKAAKTTKAKKAA